MTRTDLTISDNLKRPRGSDSDESNLANHIHRSKKTGPEMDPETMLKEVREIYKGRRKLTSPD